MIYELMVHLAQSIHLSCADTNTVSKRTEMRFHMTHITRSSIWCVQMVSKAMVCLAPTVHLSCVKISTISKRTEMSFHLSLAS
jgi:hypothetical protein